MTGYEIRIAPGVRDLVSKLPPGVKARIRNALRAVASDPTQAKTLRDELAGMRSHRAGNFRVIFRLRGRTVEVVAIGHRRDIYERAAAELRRAAK